MVLKTIGYLILYAAFFCGGDLIKKSYAARVKELELFSAAVDMITARLKYTPVGITELFYILSRGDYGVFSAVFAACAARLDNEDTDFRIIWQEEIENSALSPGFLKHDGKTVMSLADITAEPSRENVLTELESLKAELDGHARTAAADRTEKGDVYARLIRLAGLLLIVVIV